MTEKPTYEELEQRIQGLEQIESDLRRSEKALQESKDRFQLLYERAPLAYQSLDEDGNFIEINPSWLDVLGYSRDEVLGKSFGEFLHPDWKDHFKENFPRFKAIGEILGVEFEMVKKDGSLILVSFHGKIGKDKNGNFQQTHCIFQDITERKKMENSLQRYSHNLGERVKELNCLHEISKLIEQTDISFERVFQGIVYLIPPAFQHPENTCSIMLINEREYKTENFKKTKWNLNNDIFVHGECVGVLEVYCLEEKTGVDKHPFLKEEKDLINNISNRLGRIIEYKMTQENLRKSEKRYRVIMDSMREPIYICSQEFVVEYMNATMAKRIGRDTIGEKCFKAIHGFDKKCSWCNYEAIKKGDAYQLSIVSPKDNHSFDISATPIINNDGSVSMLNVFRDVTKIKKMEIQLQQAQRMESIGTLAGGIAHDFNNILFPIVGHTEMLIEDVPEDSLFRASLNEILTGAMRAGELVKQILTFSRQDSGELKFMKMQPVIKEALKLIRSSIPVTIEIRQNISSDCGVIKADPTQIHQIVMNLATNAYHAMEETGGELKVSLEEIKLDKYDAITPDMTSGVYACLKVTDTGTGMDKVVIEKIFNPFFTTKEKGKGTGMGLSVVHGIVNSMNGVIKVYSEPGKGTEFYVYLPVVDSLSEKKEILQMKEPIQGGIDRILLVDDEDAIVIMEKLMLERLGYQVTSRTSSIEALEAFIANPDKFDLVITDMAMPNMAGDKLAVELTRIRPDIPILLCTGFSEIMSEEEAAILGIKGFLLKPIVMKDLSQKIREVLDQS